MIQDDSYVDERWYERYVPLAGTSVLSHFAHPYKDLKRQEKAFIEGDVSRPDLSALKVNEGKLRADEQELERLASDISSNESDKDIQSVYIQAIQEKMSAIHIILASHAKNDRALREGIIRRYGAPFDSLYVQAMGRLRARYEALDVSGDARVQAMKDRILESVRGVLGAENVFTVPLDVFEFTKQHVEKEFQDILAHVPDSVDLADAQRIVDVFSMALESIGAHEWEARVEHGKGFSIRVDNVHSRIRVPPWKKVSYKRLRALVLHEIGTHVARSVRGRKTALKLLSGGLPRYLEAEEGIAMVRQETLKRRPVKTLPGAVTYAALGMAFGVQRQPASFREVYTFLKNAYAVSKYASGMSFEDAATYAHKKAWRYTTRIFRGTSSDSEGVCMTKDIMYVHGRIAMWELLTRDQSLLGSFNAGKYNPGNASHVRLLQKLDII